MSNTRTCTRLASRHCCTANSRLVKPRVETRATFATIFVATQLFLYFVGENALYMYACTYTHMCCQFILTLNIYFTDIHANNLLLAL